MKRSQVIQILMGVVSVWFLVAEVDAADYTVKLPAIDDREYLMRTMILIPIYVSVMT